MLRNHRSRAASPRAGPSTFRAHGSGRGSLTWALRRLAAPTTGARTSPAGLPDPSILLRSCPPEPPGGRSVTPRHPKGTGPCLTDHNGNVVRLGVENLEREDAFGAGATEAAAVEERFLYGGLEAMPEVPGVMLAQQRLYDTETGRFLAPDPIGLEGGLHRSRYVANLPTSWVDPTGRSAERHLRGRPSAWGAPSSQGLSALQRNTDQFAGYEASIDFENVVMLTTVVVDSTGANAGGTPKQQGDALIVAVKENAERRNRRKKAGVGVFEVRRGGAESRRGGDGGQLQAGPSTLFLKAPCELHYRASLTA
ncbi:MAG: RHS repeat-associated core domain-containing protein [Proteobacteria bacterium]|nr:RHS repeat-associated core domain-containing protein [Pseudomonadota bacterium]MCP4918848.1 RHS repeat-associated core domain-containing protein [Pseudomonadota bacterium]